MRHLRLLFLISVLLGATTIVRSAAAQSACSHVRFRLDTELEVNETAVCNAAEPWSDQGYTLFIFLTDLTPDDTDAWYTLLDRVEADAGLRDLNQADSFQPGVLALEASTTGADWATTITYGERLFNTAIDSDEAAGRIQTALRSGLRAGDPTAGLTDAITTAYEIRFPPPEPPSATARAVTTGIIVIVVLGVAGVIGTVLFVTVGRPALARRRRRKELETHLGGVRQNVANLLLAYERLLAGEEPQDAVLFQLFEAYGGTRYPERAAQVTDWIRRSQAAWRVAFELRRDLLSEDVKAQQDLETQVRNWEMIYLTLVGSSERVLELTNSELQDLLDPLVVLEREADDVPLAHQLNEIRREIKGMPLKINLLEVDPTTVDQEGILGYVDQVESQIGELMEAQREAPAALDEAEKERLAAEEETDTARPFGLTGSQMLREIDARLAQARQTLDAGLYLNTLATAVSVRRDLTIIHDLIAAAEDYADRLATIEAITAEGFRPAQLPVDQGEIATDIEQIKATVIAGNFLATDDWIDELDADAERAAAHAVSWKERYEFNTDSLRLMRAHLTNVQEYLQDEASPAWRALQAYPASNWKDITHDLNTERVALKAMRDERLPQIDRLNGKDVQDIPAAETALAEAGKTLLDVERRLQALVRRLDEVRSAEANLPNGLDVAQRELDTAIAFRDAEDVRISAEVDEQLAIAVEALNNARRDHATRHFMTAMRAQTQARELVAKAYAAAQEQVARINMLQRELGQISAQMEAQAQRTLALGEKLSALALTGETAVLLNKLVEQLSQARKAQANTLALEDLALAGALETAVTAFKAAQEVEQQAAQSVQADQAAYEALRSEAESAIRSATQAIGRAEAIVANPDAGGSGRAPLQRARTTLPEGHDLSRSSKDELRRIRDDARLADQYAQEAERKAEQSISFKRMARAAAWMTILGRGSHRNRPHGWSGRPGGPSSSPSVPRPRISNRSMGGSRRSSSSGGARRSGSSGGSRRSSMGGSRRR